MAIIVDDDDATRESLRFLLECEGIEVEAFASGSQLVAAPSWPPEVGCMILDVNMPGMSGIEVLEELRHRGSKVPVVVVTGHPSAANRKRALASGALDVLEKPLNDGRIIELVRHAIENNHTAG
jgi:two-component system, LuxR family, response regulator FixJ